MRFTVFTPHPYTTQSAGVKALHYLARDLQALGHEVRLAAIGSHYLRRDEKPPLECEVLYAWSSSDIENDVCVVPETYAAPFSFPVVRWMLYPQRYPIGDKDVVVTWADWANGPRLRLDLVEHDLFFDAGRERFGSLVFPPENGDVDLPYGTYSAITKDWPATREQMANVLQTHELLVSYKVSLIMEEALACGCQTFFAKGFEPPVIPPVYSAEMDDDVPRFVELCRSRLASV